MHREANVTNRKMIGKRTKKKRSEVVSFRIRFYRLVELRKGIGSGFAEYGTKGASLIARSERVAERCERVCVEILII